MIIRLCNHPRCLTAPIWFVDTSALINQSITCHLFCLWSTNLEIRRYAYVGPPRNIIRGILWCLTHIAMIFKFRNVNGPMAAKWPKVNRGLKIVNYFTCMRHFSHRWYRPPEVDLNGYPRISNPYCHDIQIQRCECTQGKKMTQSKSWIKNSKLFYMYVALLLQVVQTPRSWFKWIPKDL